MANVVGALSDISDVPLKYNPRLVFYPDRPATNAKSFTTAGGTYRAAGGALYATGEVTVTPSSTGSFSVDLHPTTDMLGHGGEATYNVRIEWIDENSQSHFIDVITGLVVPAAGGTIGGLLDASPGAQLVWVGSTPPPIIRKGVRWLYTGTTNSTYTNSHLYEWR